MVADGPARDPPAMDANDPTPEQEPTQEQAATPQPPPPPPPPHAPRLVRSRRDRWIAGVCGGLAEHFRIDPIIVRVAAVALVFAGGAGLLLYLAGVLLVPEADADEGAAAAPVTGEGRGRAATVAGGVALVVALVILIPGGLFFGAVLVPLAALALAALLVWWLSSGEGPTGTPRDVARRIALGLGVLLVCVVLACAAFWAGVAGGGEVVAAVVIGAGLALVAGAFLGGARWLILPALAIALPLSLLAAAGVEGDGSVGERSYTPRTAQQVRDHYELGMGKLVVDLRDADLPPGDRHVDLEVGVGAAELLVPQDVCVATEGRVGAGAFQVFDRETGGIDVDVDDRPTAAADAPRIIVRADVGIGAFRVGYDDRHPWRGHDGFDQAPSQGAACA
jgi:phage shock protein PspC (stress-responsive transcriptional regulator)